MLQLEIIVKPKSEKYLEFSQSLNFIKSDLQQLSHSVLISELDRIFSIILDFNSAKQLITILHSTEISILSGAINMLGDKTEVIVHGAGYKKTASNLKEIRLNYSETKKEEIDY